jgi:hypothetical protein
MTPVAVWYAELLDLSMAALALSLGANGILGALLALREDA